MKYALIASLAALIVAPAASASTPIYWTPTHMVQALTALGYPHAGIIGGKCSGLTKARSGAYAGFRCVLTWQVDGTDGNPTHSGTVRAFARPLTHGRVCGSASSLASCRLLAAGPLANDPTVCSVTDPAQCARAASQAAIVKTHGMQVNLICHQGSDVYHWNCTATAGPYTVAWAKGVSQWTATVTP